MVKAPLLNANAPVLVNVVEPAPPTAVVPPLKFKVPLLINVVTYVKLEVPLLVLVIIPDVVLLMVPGVRNCVVLLFPVIFHIALFVMVGELENAIRPACQLIVPLFVRLADKYLSVAVFIVNVLVLSTVNTRPNTPPVHVLFALIVSIPDPNIWP